MAEFRAIHRYARISGRKARYVMDLIRGRPVNEALDVLRFTHRRGSEFINKVLRSAMANATQKDVNVNLNSLFIAQGIVDEGPLLQGRMRFIPRAMGRATPIRKKTCHIRIVLSEMPEKEGGRSRRAQKTKPAAAAGGGEATTT